MSVSFALGHQKAAAQIVRTGYSPASLNTRMPPRTLKRLKTRRLEVDGKRVQRLSQTV